MARDVVTGRLLFVVERITVKFVSLLIQELTEAVEF